MRMLQKMLGRGESCNATCDCQPMESTRLRFTDVPFALRGFKVILRNYSFSDNNMSLKAIHLSLESYVSHMKIIQQLANCSHCNQRTAVSVQGLNVIN